MNEITKEHIIQSIANLAQLKGQTWLSREQFLSESGINSYQFKKYFTRWNVAVIAAGLQPLDNTGRPDKTKGMTKQELLNLAEQIASRLARRRISQSEFTKEAGISYRPIHRLYGSWESFASEVGFKLHPAYKQKIPDESLFKEYFRITAQLGHFPTYQELSFAKYSSGTFEGRFGTYSDFKVHALQ